MATAFNRVGARLVGISPNFAGALTLSVAAMLGAFSGVLIGPITTVYYESGFLVGLIVLIAVVAAARAPLLGLEVELVHRHVERSLLLVSNHFDRHVRSRLGRDDHFHQVVARRHRPPVVFENHVAWLEPGLRGGAAGRHGRHDRAGARLETEFRVVLARNRRHRHADAPANDLALTKLRQQVADRVARHGEADPEVALRARPADGPPELPGLIAASVCKTSLLRPSETWNGRWVPLMTPTVTVYARLKGLPIAITQSPGAICDESPNLASGSAWLGLSTSCKSAVSVS